MTALPLALHRAVPQWVGRADRAGLGLLGVMVTCAVSAAAGLLAVHATGGPVAGSVPAYAVSLVGWGLLTAVTAAVLARRGRLSPDAALGVLLAGSLLVNLVGVLVEDVVTRLACLAAVPLALVLAVAHVRGRRLLLLQAVSVLGALAVLARLGLDGWLGVYAAWVEAALAVLPSAVVAALATRLDRLRAEAERSARTDALTGLLNRYGLAHAAPGVLRAAVGQDHRVAVLLLDIDRFKAVNDTWGHATGDRLLQAVAAAVSGTVRRCDATVRYGGEEIAVLTHVVDDEQLAVVAGRVRRAVAGLLVPGTPPVTASIGTSSAPAEVAARALTGARGGSDGVDELVHQLLDRADGALYSAKQGGRDRVVHAGPEAPVRQAASVPQPRAPQTAGL